MRQFLYGIRLVVRGRYVCEAYPIQRETPKYYFLEFPCPQMFGQRRVHKAGLDNPKTIRYELYTTPLLAWNACISAEQWHRNYCRANPDSHEILCRRRGLEKGPERGVDPHAEDRDAADAAIWALGAATEEELCGIEYVSLPPDAWEEV